MRSARVPLRGIGILGAMAAVVVIGAAFAVRHWSRPVPGPLELVRPGSARGSNILLITVDTLRADHVGCYGYDLVETPVIDGLAREGVRFDQAITAVPMTLPSHATIMTGLYPPAHGVRVHGSFRLGSEQTTLAELLKERGYQTAAFPAAFVLDARYGLDQGFDHYDDDLTLQHRQRTPNAPLNPQRPGNIVMDAALAWLNAQRDPQRPFFLWVHLFDPHMPYTPPRPFKDRYRDRPYDGEIAFADQQVGRLVDAIDDLGLADGTVTLVIGDHGEGLGDHGETTHRQLIYDSTMRVPMILHAPGILTPGQVVDHAAAGTVDVMPTILDLLGLNVPKHCDGRSLLSGGLDPQRCFYVETLSPQLDDGWAPLFGIRRVADKYIDAPGPEYYDLAADRGELDNLWHEEHEEAGVLARELDGLRESFPAGVDASMMPSAEELRKLQALGYLGGTVDPAAADSNLDPKVMIHTFHDRLAAIDLVHRGRIKEAIATYHRLIEQSPQSAELWSLLGRAQQAGGRIDDALASAMRACELQPSNADYLCTMASLQLAVGDDEAADATLALAERMRPGFGRIWMIRARHAMSLNLDDEALEHCQRAIEVDPVRSAAEAYALSGLIHQRLGQGETARADFDAALEHDPRNGPALLARAKIAAEEGETQPAIELLESLIQGQPEYLEGGRLLGRLYFERGDPEISRRIFQLIVRRDPGDGEAHYQLSRVLAAQGELDSALEHLARAAEIGTIDFALVRSDPAFQSLADDPRLARLEEEEED